MSLFSRLLFTSFMICVMAFGVLVTASFALRLDAKDLSVAHFEDVITGKFTSKFESVYEKNVPFHSTAVQLFNAISLNVFEEARIGALLGRDGWLFTTEEFSWLRSSEANLSAAFRRVKEVKTALDAKGIKLVVLPIPAKAAVIADKLGGLTLPVRNAGVYDRFLTFMKDNDIRFVDLRAVFAVPNPDSLFLVSDTHWSTQGSDLAAHALCKAISGQMTLNKTTFEATARKEILHVGDLAKFVDTGWFSPTSALAAERIVGVDAARAASDAASLFAEPTTGTQAAIPLTLVGTSYSANPIWSFEDHLKIACGLDVLNLSQEGRGPFAPMNAFLKSFDDEPASAIVIWEIPVRYMDDLDNIALHEVPL